MDDKLTYSSTAIFADNHAARHHVLVALLVGNGIRRVCRVRGVPGKIHAFSLSIEKCEINDKDGLAMTNDERSEDNLHMLLHFCRRMND